MIRALSFVVLLLLLSTGAAAAQTLGQWSVDLGFATRVHPGHIGSSQNIVDVLPVVEAQYGDRIQISLDDGAKWTALKAGRFTVGPVAEYRQSYDDKLPPRSKKLSDDVELGGFAGLDLSVATVEGRVRQAVNGYGGASADLAVDSGLRLGPFGAIGVELRSSWADRSYSRALFGHNLAGADPARFADYVTMGGQISYLHPLPHHFDLALVASDDAILQPAFAVLRNHSNQVRGLSLILTRHFGRLRTPRF